MKKLKVYESPSIQLISIGTHGTFCEQILGGSQFGTGDTTTDTEGGIESGEGVESGAFRPGIWDQDDLF